MPVCASHLPVPSRFMLTLTRVSLVLRSTTATLSAQVEGRREESCLTQSLTQLRGHNRCTGTGLNAENTSTQPDGERRTSDHSSGRGQLLLSHKVGR